MIKVCSICGKEIRWPSRRFKYCSDECEKIGRKAINKKYYLKSKLTSKKVTKKCYKIFNCLECPYLICRYDEEENPTL